jgi:hypothetical protein
LGGDRLRPDDVRRIVMQYSTALRNAKLDAVETILGPDPVLKIFGGAMPANPAAADAGAALATLQLPSDWMLPAADGRKAKSGTWEDLSADASGTGTHYRFYTSGGICHWQGTFGTSGTEMVANTATFVAGQKVVVNALEIVDGNA